MKFLYLLCFLPAWTVASKIGEGGGRSLPLIVSNEHHSLSIKSFRHHQKTKGNTNNKKGLLLFGVHNNVDDDDDEYGDLAFDPTVADEQIAKKKNDLLSLRGGACDASPDLFQQVAMTGIVQTVAMTAVLVLSERLRLLPNVLGLPILSWMAMISVIFASSFFGTIADGGLSAANIQVLDPNAVPGDPDWYANLIKPSWNPPGWVFPVMWLIVSKPTQLIALSKIMKRLAAERGSSDSGSSVSSKIAQAKKAGKDVAKSVKKNKSVALNKNNGGSKKATLLTIVLAIYCLHLSLGDAWNKVFFGLQCTGRGAAVITTFFGMLLTSTVLFGHVDTSAGKYMLPTCGWVLIATALNWNIYLNNK